MTIFQKVKNNLPFCGGLAGSVRRRTEPATRSPGLHDVALGYEPVVISPLFPDLRDVVEVSGEDGMVGFPFREEVVVSIHLVVVDHLLELEAAQGEYGVRAFLHVVEVQHEGPVHVELVEAVDRSVRMSGDLRHPVDEDVGAFAVLDGVGIEAGDIRADHLSGSVAEGESFQLESGVARTGLEFDMGVRLEQWIKHGGEWCTGEQ